MKLLTALLFLLALMSAPVVGADTQPHHWAGVVQVDYVEGRHLELARSCPDDWVLVAQDPALEARLEGAIGNQAVVWGQEFLEATIWMKPTIIVEGVWLRGDPVPQGIPPRYPCP